MLVLCAGYADVDELRLDAEKLGLGLRHVDLRGHAPLEAALRELKVSSVARECVLEQTPLRIEPAHLEVVGRELRADTERHARQIGGAGRGVGAALLDRPADLPPQI